MLQARAQLFIAIQASRDDRFIRNQKKKNEKGTMAMYNPRNGELRGFKGYHGMEWLRGLSRTGRDVLSSLNKT
jgi:heme-degrading monooxygenase HmoA